jgi:lipocalin
MAQIEVQDEEDVILVEFEDESGLWIVSRSPQDILEQSVDNSKKPLSMP